LGNERWRRVFAESLVVVKDGESFELCHIQRRGAKTLRFADKNNYLSFVLVFMVGPDELTPRDSAPPRLRVGC